MQINQPNYMENLTTPAPPVPISRLVQRLRNYYYQLAPHQKSREAAILIMEAANEIERMENACNKWSEDEMLNPITKQ